MNLKTHHHNYTTKYHLLLILSAKLRLLLQAPLYILHTTSRFRTPKTQLFFNCVLGVILFSGVTTHYLLQNTIFPRHQNFISIWITV